jgi:hypothetical protein
MAKAGGDSSLPWMTLQAARRLALAEQRLLAAMTQATPADWRHGYAENIGSDITNFWQHPSRLVVDWEAGSAYRNEVHPSEATIIRGAALYGIEVRRDYLKRCFGLLPRTDQWLIAEVEEILKSGAASTGRPLAKEVHRRMVRASKADPNIKLLKPGTIRNKIVVFGLVRE